MNKNKYVGNHSVYTSATELMDKSVSFVKVFGLHIFFIPLMCAQRWTTAN